MSQIDDYAKLRDYLKQSIDEKYREFSMKICQSKYPMLGIRVPQIRKYAKQIPVDKIEKFIKVRPLNYEEILLRGLLIARLPYDNMLKWFDFITQIVGANCPSINNLQKAHSTERVACRFC